MSRLEYRFTDWLGDGIVETFPCFVVTEELARKIDGQALSGAVLAEVEVTLSPEAEDLLDRDLPAWKWLQITGEAFSADFGVSEEHRLVVSDAALNVLRQGGLECATIEEIPMTDVTYSERWSDLAGGPTGVISEEVARERHQSGEAYTVTIGNSEDPDRVLDVVWKNDHLGVWFFDDQVRRSVHFSFKVHGERLFLGTVMNWKYPEGARLRNEATTIERVTFTPGGIVTHEITDKVAGEKTTRDLADVDVTSNWEEIPAFGQWDSVTRFNRE